MSALVEAFWTEYVASSGLARLDTSDDYWTLPDGTETVRNDNGILFLCYFLLVMKLKGLDVWPYVERVKTTVKSLERKPGLYSRQKIPTILEAQDNPAAICCLSSMYDQAWARDRYMYGVLHGGNFNDLNPEQWVLQGQMQNGEMAYYALSAGVTPGVFDFIWFLVGILINAFTPKSYPVNLSSNTLLAWMRINAVKQKTIVNQYYSAAFHLVVALWSWRVKSKYGSLHGVIKEYFRPEHPIVKLSEGVKTWH